MFYSMGIEYIQNSDTYIAEIDRQSKPTRAQSWTKPSILTMLHHIFITDFDNSYLIVNGFTITVFGLGLLFFL